MSRLSGSEDETDEETDTLLLCRTLGRARPEDYVRWAVDCLCRDCDSPALRILAGLNVRLEGDEIEQYFALACAELGIADLPSPRSPLATARMIRRAYERGRVPPSEVVEMMAEVYKFSESQDELLAPWYDMREEMAWGEGSYYPPLALASVERAVDREWSLFDRALTLTLPEGWLRFFRCTDCHHVGQVRVQEPLRVIALWAALRRRPALSVAVCERCSSKKITSLLDPDARGAYLDQMARLNDGHP